MGRIAEFRLSCLNCVCVRLSMCVIDGIKTKIFPVVCGILIAGGGYFLCFAVKIFEIRLNAVLCKDIFENFSADETRKIPHCR